MKTYKLCSYAFVFAFLSGVFGVLMASGQAFAQDQSNIEQRVDSVVFQQTPSLMRPDEQILTGREDLVLLIKRKLFEAYISPSYQYTNNAFLSNNNRKEDGILTLTGGLRFSTLVANTVNFFADISATGARYNSHDQLDYNAIQGSVGLGYVDGPWSYVFTYSPSYVYDDEFDDHLVTLHRISGTVSHAFIIKDNFFVSPYISAQLTPSDPNEFGYYQGDVGVNAVLALPHNVSINAGPRLYTKRYFDYFESQTGTQRRDHGLGVAASVSWKPLENVSLNAVMSFSSNQSSLSNNEYDAFTAAPSARLSVRF